MWHSRSGTAAAPGCAPRLLPLFLLLLLLPCSTLPQAHDPDAFAHAHVDMHARCQALSSAYQERHPAPSPAPNASMLYFLHVPRTAGRTFHSCFLKSGTPPSKRCPKAYDHLRINTSVPNCQLLSSHDDYSVLALLPDNAAVVTQLRDPVDRFLSAYEFAVEVAARKLRSLPRSESQAELQRRQSEDKDRMLTENVWPWSYLVPFFMQDMQQRMSKLEEEQEQAISEGQGYWIHVRDPDGDDFYHNKAKNESKWALSDSQRESLLPPLDPYNNPLVMPLEEFVGHSIAEELLHNGQAFQVLGVTNYSHWGDAGEMRGCVWADEAVQAHMLDVAAERVMRFSHVGTTDRLAHSVAAAAAALTLPLSGPAYAGAEGNETQGAPDAPPSGDGGTTPSAPEGATGGDAHERVLEQSRGVRKARLRLQELQKRLFALHQAGQSDSEEAQRLGRDVQVTRDRLRKAQEALGASRARLPSSVVDRSLDEEAGVAVPKQEDQAQRTLGARLGVEFLKCAQRAQQRSADRRDSSLGGLAMPADGRTFRFGREQRARIPAHVIEVIRARNSMDVRLHRLADELLTQARERLAAAAPSGRLEELPVLPVGPGRRGTPARDPKKAAVGGSFAIPKPADERPADLAKRQKEEL